jgi:hypothetical protein
MGCGLNRRCGRSTVVNASTLPGFARVESLSMRDDFMVLHFFYETIPNAWRNASPAAQVQRSS